MSAQTGSESTYLQVTLKMNVQWDPANPDRVRLWSANAAELAALGMTDEQGERPGIQLVFSSNVRSADYHTPHERRKLHAGTRDGIPEFEARSASVILLRFLLLSSLF